MSKKDILESARHIVRLADQVGERPKWDDPSSDWERFFDARAFLAEAIEDEDVPAICRALLAAKAPESPADERDGRGSEARSTP